MNKTTLGFAVLALSTFAHAETTTNATTSNYDSSTVNANHSDTNSNDRFDNRDTRTNSTATPATIGKENSKLGSIDRSRRSTSAATNSQVAPAPVSVGTSASDDTGYNSQNNRMERSSDSTMATTEAKSSHHPVRHSKHHRAIKTSTSSTETAKLNSRTGSSTSFDKLSTAGVAAGSAYNTKKTAQDQGTAQRELEITRKIRSDITDNKDLSVSAHNIKIISENGHVLLKGPVATPEEKSQVEMMAKRVAGNSAVINETYVERR